MDVQATTQVLGNLGEFVGAIAVVVTLGYLAIQIRQNTRSNSISRGMAIIEQRVRLREHMMINGELAELAARCRKPSIAELSGVDEERLRNIAGYYTALYSSIEVAYRRGEFEKRQYESFCTDMRKTISEYPALKPYIRNEMEPFDYEYFRILSPVWEGD